MLPIGKTLLVLGIFAAIGCQDREQAQLGENTVSPPPSKAKESGRNSEDECAYWDGGSQRAECVSSMPDAGMEESPFEEDGRDFSLRSDCCICNIAQTRCWWKDADRDGAVCGRPSDLPCPYGNSCDLSVRGPSGQGLCRCDNENNAANVCRKGVCLESCKRCSPSFCNGYTSCSCWGGCENVFHGRNQSGDIISTPEEKCASLGKSCCEGGYPGDPSGWSLGDCCTQ